MNETEPRARAGRAHALQVEDGASGATRGRRRQRAVMATDSEWQALRERAEAAGMDVSRFIVERLTAPAAEPGGGAAARDLSGAVARIERAVCTLVEIERRRLEDNGEGRVWETVVRRATDRVDLEERLG